MNDATRKIPVLDLNAEIAELRPQLLAAIEKVLDAGQFIMGPEVAAFERSVAQHLGAAHAVAVNSGTDALVISLRALGVGPGDKVITSPFTFFATAEAISAVGAQPVFADVDLRTFNIDPEAVKRAIGPRTKAILPVHLFGRPADMDCILELAKRHKLAVLEDVAQAFGGEWQGRALGTLGNGGAFSFFPSKNLGAYGDGGMILTNDSALADQARMLRTHGSRKKYFNETIGYNSRLDTLQAAILQVKLPHIREWNEMRRAAAARYNEMLAGIPQLVLPEIVPGHVFHQYTVRVLGGARDAVQQRLAAAGIGTMIYYPVPLHRLPVYSHIECTCPNSERLAGEVLSLPIWPQIAANAQEHVCKAVRMALRL